MPFRLKSLSTELTITFASLALGLVVFLSFFAFQMASRSLDEAVRRDLFNMVDQASAALDKEIEERIREVQTISLAPTISDGAIYLSKSHVTIPIAERQEDLLRKRFDGATCLNERPEVTDHLRLLLATHHHISELLLTDRFGIAIGCTQTPQRIRHAPETWWQEAVNRGVSLSNLEPDPATGEYHYAVSIAIPDGNRSPAGVLRAILNLNGIQASLRSMRIGDRGFVVAMGRTGTLFAHPRPDYLWKKVDEVPELAYLSRVVATKSQRGVLIYEPPAAAPDGDTTEPAPPVNTAAIDPDSPETLARAPEGSWILAYGRMFRPASLGPLGWTVVATVSRAEVIAPVVDVGYQVAAVGGSVLLVAIAIVWFLSLRLTRPLNNLAMKADLIAAGDHSIYLSIPSGNEIGRLASALASMVDSLGEANRSLARANTNLEKIVAERTRELREKSRLLEEQSKQVLEASRLKSQFLANMSHELRTPLNAILALSDILAQRISGDLNEEQVKQVTIINRSGGNLLRLINDILDLSKIEAGRTEVHLDVFDLKASLIAVRDTIEPLAGDKSLEFNIVVDPALPSAIRSDDPKLRQVLLNLLGNAVKFTDHGGVTLTLSHRYRTLPGTDQEPPPITDEGPFWLELKVHDTGVGITPEALQHIFEEFQQADGSTTRKYGGSGLGLAITKKIVELLGGELSVQSVPGKGSTFTATIPVEGVATQRTEGTETRLGVPMAVASHPGRDVAALPSDRRAQPAGTRGLSRPVAQDPGVGPKPWVTPLREHPVPVSPRFLDIRDDANSLLPHIPTLLVVDDDPESLYVYRQFLGRQGYQVIFAINGEQVLDKARQFKPVAIILDLMLPQKSGWEVLEELKVADDLRDIPVIIASALDHRDRGLCAGAFRFLTKPMAERQLLSVLRELEAARKKDVRRVLVIDDDPVELGIARTLFEKAGLDVTTIENPQEALDHASRELPDIIVLDLLMPVMDGFEVVSRLKAEPRTATIPILIYTAKEITEEDRRRLLPSARRIFPKVPLQIEEMLDELERALETVAHRPRARGQEGPASQTDPAGGQIVVMKDTSAKRKDPGARDGSPDQDSPRSLHSAAGDEQGLAEIHQPQAPQSGRSPAAQDSAAAERWIPETLTPVTTDPGSSSGASRTRILLVEDDLANQYSIGFLLRSAGYEVIIACDGQEGLTVAQRDLPDIILMDMMMPVMSGFDATRHLKRAPGTRDIPVIALTAAAMAGDRERTLAAGCNDYVSKPVDRLLLLERIRHWESVILGAVPAARTTGDGLPRAEDSGTGAETASPAISSAPAKSSAAPDGPSHGASDTPVGAGVGSGFSKRSGESRGDREGE